MTGHPVTSFLEVDDLDPARLRALLDHAVAWKADPSRVPRVLAGRAAAALFQKPSARTRISLEVAVATAGGDGRACRRVLGKCCGRPTRERERTRPKTTHANNS